MSPLRESFGEEWVDMDEEEDTEKIKGEALVEANLKVDGIGGYKTSNKMEKGEGMICKEASIESLSQVHMPSGLENKKDNFLVEMDFEVSEEVSESKEKIEGNCLECTGKQCLKNGNEQYLEVECTNHDMQERIPLKEPYYLGWTTGEVKRAPMLKRVTSEASFMRLGQVMVSKSESIQVVLSKRESSKVKLEGIFFKDWGNEETKMREDLEKCEDMVEVVLYKNGSNEKTRDKVKKDGSEEVMGAHQVPSIMCAMPLEAVHTRPCTSKDVHMHPMASKAVCAESKAWKDSKRPSMSKGSKTLNKVHMHLEALEGAQVHPEVTSKAVKELHMVSMETQMHPKADDVLVKASEEVHMPVERLKPTQVHTKTMEAAADCQVKDSEGVQMQLNKSKAHSKVKNAGSRRVKALEVVSMGEKSPQKEQGEGVGKQGSGGQLEVKEVECECCGMGEECSVGYIEHVKGVFSGHWVCGLCAEAVHEERHRLGRGIPMEEAVRTHMNLCKQFSSKKKVGEPPHDIGVAHAVCHLLSRHLSDPPSPRQITPARPLLSRTTSCLPSFSHNTPCTT